MLSIFYLSINRSIKYYTFIHTLQASGTLRPDRRQSLAIGRLENNICHVVYAYEMLASDVCYIARVCGGPWLGQDALWVHQ